MELQNRAKFFARVTNHLYAKRDLRAKLVTATRGARHLSLGIRLSNPLKLDDALRLAEPLALATNTPAVISQRRKDTPGLVSYQFELQQGYWQSYTRADVTGLGIGLAESKKQVDFTFDAPHCLVAGSTGCGKSVSVASILTGLCVVYTPDQLRLVVIDPHHDYADLDNLAHLALPIAREHDQIDNVLAWTGQELARRKDSNVKNAHRILLVIDEGEDVLGDDKRLAITQAIASGGRKFNVNLMVSTQKPKQTTLPNLINQLGNRFVGKCDNAQTSALLTGHAGLQAHKLTGAGDFLHTNGNVERLQVAMPTRQDYDGLPRAEIVWPTLEEDAPILSVESERKPGRPQTEIDPYKAGYYLFYGPDNVTINQAREVLDLARSAHYKYREFVQRMLFTRDKLKGARA